MISHVAALILVLLFQAQSPPAVGRIGWSSERLGAAELAQIEQLAKHAHGRPWAIQDGSCATGPGFACLTLYLEPETRSPQLWRGRALRLSAREPPIVPSRSPWTSSSSYRYAYAPSGRHEKWPVTPSERNMPFGVGADIDDKTLVSLVQFLRRNPRTGFFGPRLRGSDLSWVEPRDGGFEVSFARGSDSIVALVRRRFLGWSVQDVRFVVV